jgi:hypothetical protein
MSLVFFSLSPKDWKRSDIYDYELGISAMSQSALSYHLNTVAQQSQWSVPHTNAPSTTMRTIYLGGIPSHLTLEEIINHIKGGVIEQIKHFPEKNCCFITFLDSNVAFNIFTEAQTKRYFFSWL